MDRKSRLLWLWLPKELQDNYAGLQLDGNEQLYLGSLEPILIDSRLTLIQLESEQFSKIDRLQGLEPLVSTEVASLPGGLDLAQSLHEYVHSDQPDSGVVRLIAWYASSYFEEIQKIGLAPLLQRITLEDPLKQHQASKELLVNRAPSLFEELRRSVEARHLVFLLGGAKSGLTAFVDQFKVALAAQHPRGAHLSADFSPDTFKQVHTFLSKFSSLMTRLGCDLDTPSLFITLAYAAYQSLLASDETDYKSLTDFLPRRTASDIEEFSLHYISNFGRQPSHTDDIGSGGLQIETFLLFVGTLVEAAGRTTTLTVILSFPGLTDWLLQTRGQETASRVGRSLWKALKAFADTNYESLRGHPKAGSFMSRFNHKFGIVVEMQQLSFPDISDSFCRQSVLVLPPFSDDELRGAWEQRTQIVATHEIIARILRQTSGAPWFVDFLLECFEAVSGVSDTSERLTSAIDLTKNIILDRAIPQSYERLREQWKLYVGALISRMSAQTLTDHNTLLTFMRAAKNREKMPNNIQAVEWLESGLIWLKHPLKVHTLTALENYPYIQTFQQPELISLFIKSLTTPEAILARVS